MAEFLNQINKMNTMVGYGIKSNNNKIFENHEGYVAILNDPRWVSKRQEILERDNNRCANCGSKHDLQVHHRQYHFSRILNVFVNPWEYDQRYLITLCEKCHKKGHTNYKVPVKYLNY